MEDISFFGSLMSNFGIGLTYVLVGIAALGAIGSSVMDVVRDFSKAKQAGIGLAVFAVVLIISYVLASDVVFEIPGMEPEKMEAITPSVVKKVGMGLYAFYILFFVAIVAAVYAEVSKLFK